MTDVADGTDIQIQKAAHFQVYHWIKENDCLNGSFILLIYPLRGEKVSHLFILCTVVESLTHEPDDVLKLNKHQWHLMIENKLSQPARCDVYYCS